jgi:hypothetical protein
VDYKIHGGAHSAVKVRLNAHALSMLKRTGRAKVSFVLTAGPPNEPTPGITARVASAHATLTLAAPRKR